MFIFHAKAQILTFYFCLFSLFLPRQERAKIGTSTATDERREQTMAEQMITSESGKQQKFTVFVPFCSALLAVHFGQFNPLCVSPPEMARGKKNK